MIFIMDHDHSSATHYMTCPVDGCEHVVEVHAHDDEGAVEALMEAGKAHFAEVHPDAKGMSPEEMEETTKKLTKKHEH